MKNPAVSLRSYLTAVVFALVAVPLLSAVGVAYWRIYSLIKANSISVVESVANERRTQLDRTLVLKTERAGQALNSMVGGVRYRRAAQVLL